MTTSSFAFLVGITLSMVGFLLACYALKALPNQPHTSQKLLAVGLIVGLSSILIRGLSGFTGTL